MTLRQTTSGRQRRLPTRVNTDNLCNDLARRFSLLGGAMWRH